MRAPQIRNHFATGSPWNRRRPSGAARRRYSSSRSCACLSGPPVNRTVASGKARALPRRDSESIAGLPACARTYDGTSAVAKIMRTALFKEGSPRPIVHPNYY
jgi:hypothetical protein